MKDSTGSYRICVRCVMDTSDPSIRFDENGVCSNCRAYDNAQKRFGFSDRETRDRALARLVGDIKREGKGKAYDCVIGLSGGVDSSYAALVVKKQLGLRPLAVHVDNGWNTELSVKNVENIVKTLGIDLRTCVLDWNEFRSLQRAFLESSVVDIEMLSDNAILVLIDRMAKAHGVRYFLAGTNSSTESVMPPTWFYNIKYDSRNILGIYRRHSQGVPLRKYPRLGVWDYFRYRYFPGVRMVSILNYVDYVKKDAQAVLQSEVGWRDYGSKHCESKITEFYQNHILPQKFHVDKRRAFLSSLIHSGQTTRDAALEELKKPLYDPARLKEDREYVLSKLGYTQREFDDIMARPPRSHYDYPSFDHWHRVFLGKVVSFLKPVRDAFRTARGVQ